MSTPLTRIDRILFVYSRENQLRCLTADDARGRELDLLADGWYHTATIDPAKWIESLPNSDILERVNELLVRPVRSGRRGGFFYCARHGWSADQTPCPQCKSGDAPRQCYVHGWSASTPCPECQAGR